jgi:tRNA threonylcarbamoyladenosine biosynthesis protein TsaE
MKYVAKNLEETQKIAGEFVKTLRWQGPSLPSVNSATIVGLYGELGSGKTSFTQGVALALGISETVVSPTFVIEKIYELTRPTEGLGSNQNFSHLIHIDAYRLEKSSELLHLGWQEIIADPKNLILIEWPERVADIIPEHIRINFCHIENEQRKIEVVDKN